MCKYKLFFIIMICLLSPIFLNGRYLSWGRIYNSTGIDSSQIFLSEGFNELTFPPIGWQNVIIAGISNWQRKTSNIEPTCIPYEGSAMASFPSYSAPDGSMARLISPLINLGTSPMPCTLKFAMYHDNGYSDNPDSVKVEYSIDGINFNRVTAFRRYQPYTTWTDHLVYLGTFSGTIYIGLLAFSDYGNNMNIDYVRLTGNATVNDVGVDAIISPATSHMLNTPMIPIARVKNYGSVTQNNFQVICTIVGTGTDKEIKPQITELFTDYNVGQGFSLAKSLSKPKGLPYEDNKSDIIRYVDTLRITSLAPGETTRVNFRSWIPTNVEICTVKMRTNLAGDQNPANDQKTRTTFIRPVYMIISPNGGEVWAGATYQQIKWYREAPIFARHLLLLSQNSGVTYTDTIADYIDPNDTTYNWLVPMLNLNSCRVMIQVLNEGGAIRAQDTSDADFTIDSQAPTAPILIAPINNTYTRDSIPRFWWHKSTDAEEKSSLTTDKHRLKQIKELFKDNDKSLSGIANYQLQFTTDSSFTGAISINVSDTFYQVLTRLNDTTYYWRVRAIDSAGNQSNWSSVWSFEIDTRVPNIPTLISPINGIWLTNTNVIFNWSQVIFDVYEINENVGQGFSLAKSLSNPKGLPYKEPLDFISPVRYILQVDTTTNFISPITDTTSFVYDTLNLQQKRYYWRVRPYDLAGNQGIFSTVDSFGIDNTPPSIPNLISPTNSAILNDSFVRFYWNRSADNISGIRDYQIQIANNSSFNNPIDTTLNDTTYLRKLTDTTYYWRVRATDNANNQSDWSTVRNFTVSTTGIEEEQRNALPAITMLYSPKPNPVTNGITHISYSLAKPNHVSLKIYNTSGNLVKILVNELKSSGIYNVIWNGKDEHDQRVAEGVYFYTLETSNQNFTKKLVLMK